MTCLPWIKYVWALPLSGWSGPLLIFHKLARKSMEKLLSRHYPPPFLKERLFVIPHACAMCSVRGHCKRSRIDIRPYPFHYWSHDGPAPSHLLLIKVISLAMSFVDTVPVFSRDTITVNKCSITSQEYRKYCYGFHFQQ